MRPVRLGIIAAALAAMLGGTAAAASPFGPVDHVTPTSCGESQTVLDADGATHGFMVCGLNRGRETLFYVSAAPGQSTWSRQKVAPQADLMAVADDGSASYALYDGGGGTRLLTRSRSGVITNRRLSKQQWGDAEGALLAKNGKWWAVWIAPTKLTGSTLCFYLFQAKTIGRAQPAHNTHLCGQEPSLAFAADRSPVLTFRGPDIDYGGNISVTRWQSGAWSKPHQLNAKNTAGEFPSIAVSGHTTRVIWLHQVEGSVYDVMLSTKSGNGRWHTKHFIHHAAFDNVILTRPQVAASDGQVFLAWTVATKQKKEIVRVEQKGSGGWSSRDVGDGSSGDAVLDSLQALNGRAYLVIDHSDTTIYTVTRHQ